MNRAIRSQGEDAIYDSQAIRGFVGIDLNREAAPDATIIAAPSSTKNQDGKRDPEMHQARKGNQWHFGMKARIGVDAESGLTHTLVTTAANTNDVTQAHALSYGAETIALGDAGYQGVEKRKENRGTRVKREVAMRPGKRRALPDTTIGRLQDRIEQIKASLRAKVEHPFKIVKNLFDMKKVRYRGLAKNTAQFYALFAESAARNRSGIGDRNTATAVGKDAGAGRRDAQAVTSDDGHASSRGVRRGQRPERRDHRDRQRFCQARSATTRSALGRDDPTLPGVIPDSTVNPVHGRAPPSSL